MAQKKIGVFIHGFNGSGDKWTIASKAPEELKLSGIIDDYVVFNYRSEELIDDFSREQMFTRFVGQMLQKGTLTDEWILLGHSLGGLVSRVLYPEFRNFGFNVTSIISIGGPSQGAAATDVDTTLIRSELNRLRDDFRLATDHEWPLLSFFLDVGNVLNFLFLQLPTLGDSEPSVRTALNKLPNMIEIARDSALGYANYVLESNASDLIGINGSIITDINLYPETYIPEHPENFLSIIGAEKDPTPIRMANHIFTSDENNDEIENLSELNTLDYDYLKRNKDHWGNVAARWNLCAWFSSNCRSSRDAANIKKSYWNTARNNLHSLGTVWITIINSYRFEEVSYQVFIPPCEDDNGMPGPILDIIPNEPDPYGCSQYPNGHYETFNSTVKIADKNDGVVNIHSVLWSDDDSFNNIENDPNNQYFPDVVIDNNGNDVGGWNHFELRHYWRPYSLPGNGSDGYAFKKGGRNPNGTTFGDKNPSMEFVENWIRDLKSNN
jgi:pimeloyl-ACP methyl ester carboxylesterase